jgi:hypothetical protein
MQAYHALAALHELLVGSLLDAGVHTAAPKTSQVRQQNQTEANERKKHEKMFIRRQ